MSAGGLGERLLRWYQARRRDLPWRKDIAPYRTWISEIMLQQTTVSVVVPYFERFLAHFPDVAALAKAPEREVMKLWAGLGYYSRARNLRRAADKIVAEHGGVFPSRYEDVLALPGIGRYTAGAILSIAFGQPIPLVDGNVARVFSRFFGVRGDIKKPRTQRRLWAIAKDNLETASPGDWNQALMELGATVCLPASPLCASCPVYARCFAFKKGLQDEIPEVGKKKDFVELSWTCLWIEKGGKILLWKRGENERFLKGHWGLPEARHLNVAPGRALKTARHTITHHKIALAVREAAAPKKLPPEARWAPQTKLDDFLVSSLWRKARP